jgi:hypothetical protein
LIFSAACLARAVIWLSRENDFFRKLFVEMASVIVKYYVRHHTLKLTVTEVMRRSLLFIMMRRWPFAGLSKTCEQPGATRTAR